MVNLITTNASSHPSHGALGTLVQLELRGALPGPRTCRGAVQTPAELQDLALSHSVMPWAVQANAWGTKTRQKKLLAVAVSRHVAPLSSVATALTITA